LDDCLMELDITMVVGFACFPVASLSIQRFSAM
jgi:hypothetical protein